nr:Os03g0383100 [Ipomoea batatas]GME17374.1 Os03g0383100 [Ipomoea batatas]
MDVVIPHIFPFSPQIPNHLPQATVALKPRPEADHENPVAFLEPLLGLHVAQNVPKATSRGVAEPVERHSRRLEIVLAQVQILPDPVDHRLPARVQAEMVHPGLEVVDESAGGGFRERFPELEHGFLHQTRFIRQKNRASAGPEQTVGQNHGSVVPGVPVGAERLRGYNQRVQIPLRLKNILYDVNRYQASAAPHSR